MVTSISPAPSGKQTAATSTQLPPAAPSYDAGGRSEHGNFVEGFPGGVDIGAAEVQYILGSHVMIAAEGLCIVVVLSLRWG